MNSQSCLKVCGRYFLALEFLFRSSNSPIMSLVIVIIYRYAQSASVAKEQITNEAYTPIIYSVNKAIE